MSAEDEKSLKGWVVEMASRRVPQQGRIWISWKFIADCANEGFLSIAAVSWSISPQRRLHSLFAGHPASESRMGYFQIFFECVPSTCRGKLAIFEIHTRRFLLESRNDNKMELYQTRKLDLFHMKCCQWSNIFPYQFGLGS